MKNDFNTPNYNCQQGELYSAGDIIWSSCRDYLSEFAANKAFYTPAYVDAAIAEINSAILLPDQYARVGLEKEARIELAAASAGCCKKWQLLKSYLGFSFKGDLLKTKLIAAGSAYYREAGLEDWEKVRLLMAAGSGSITENSVKLMEGDNMPASFQAQFEGEAENFQALYKAFKKAEGVAIQKTQEKITQNNKLYDKVISVCKDGQLIFGDNPGIKQLFIFENVLQTVSSPGAAGLTGTIIDAKTGGGLTGVALSLFAGNNVSVTPKYTTTSVGNGGYDFGNIVSGNYTLKMEHSGFVTREVTVDVKVGVVGSKTFMMNE